jgi:hypothetical protein
LASRSTIDVSKDHAVGRMAFSQPTRRHATISAPANHPGAHRKGLNHAPTSANVARHLSPLQWDRRPQRRGQLGQLISLRRHRPEVSEPAPPTDRRSTDAPCADPRSPPAASSTRRKSNERPALHRECSVPVPTARALHGRMQRDHSVECVRSDGTSLRRGPDD